jgi:tetratricopeptide (TPR) repeat protein
MLRRMRFRRRLRALALVGCVAGAAVPQIGLAEETSAANVAAARKHFERARAYYGQGAYRDAIVELEAAHGLDPSAKDLVFNLGVVHEKLADIDEALKWFKLYTTMDLVPQEHDRADAYIRRLEGVKRELEDKQAVPQPPNPDLAQPPVEPTATSPTKEPPPPGPPHPPLRQPVPPPAPSSPPSPAGRVDGLTLGAAGLSTAALAFGIVVGVKAGQDEPPSGYTTGTNGTYSNLVNKTGQAHNEALLADVGFGVALASGLAAAYLYFGRQRVAPAANTGATTVSAAPLPGGGALVAKGRF